MPPSGIGSSAAPQATIAGLGEGMDLQHWPRIPINLIMHAISVMSRGSDSRLDELRGSVKAWEEWDALTALANYHSVVEILFGFLKKDSTADRSSHAIATEIFEKMSQDVSAISAQMILILRYSETYKQFLACRGSLAQQILDLVQDLLDSFAAARPLLSKALIRLSRVSGLHPRCFVLSGLEKEGHQVAAGGYGDIWKGRVRGQTVSVKMMRVFRDKDIQAALKAFGREALIWRQLSHPNLLPFFGLYHLENRLCLVSPWMENGHVLEFLKNSPPDTDRLSLIVDIAIGLEYLHTEQIVHGDLKGMNILITPSGRACIADFGLSTIDVVSLGFTHSTSSVQGGTARYQAPELLLGSSNHYASDVYAFACVCYEILTGKAPFFELRNEMAVSLKVMGGARPSRPGTSECNPILWSLLEDCWNPDPNIRPLMAQTKDRLINPPINGKATESTRDWDETSTSKFRRHFQDWPLLPSITEIERRMFGDETVEECVHCKPMEPELTPLPWLFENVSSAEIPPFSQDENPGAFSSNPMLPTTAFGGRDTVMDDNAPPGPPSGPGQGAVSVLNVIDTPADLPVGRPSTRNGIEDRNASREGRETPTIALVEAKEGLKGEHQRSLATPRQMRNLQSQQIAQPEVIPPSRFPSPAPGTPNNFKPDRVLWPENVLDYESGYTSSWVWGPDHGKPSWHDLAPTPNPPFFGAEHKKYSPSYGASKVPLPPSWVNSAYLNLTAERQIHPWLDGDAPSPVFHFDLSPGTFAPLRLVSTNPHGALSDADMREPAFHPPLTKLRILFSGVSLWHVDLRLRETLVQAPIALGDVLVTVHHAMHERITREDWAALSPENERAVTKAFTQRCHAEALRNGVSPGQLREQVKAKRNQGVKRVDFLLGKTVFKGLVRKPGDPEECLLMLTV
ncbi:hypothetical protein C8R44DRAFT_684926 [Mycena epipterygia]|nr:hypothetical protein C8R44DRAFT_684926 [Mycena epipterygia]